MAAKYLVLAAYRNAIAVRETPVLPDAVSVSARIAAMRAHPFSFRPAEAKRPAQQRHPLRLVS